MGWIVGATWVHRQVHGDEVDNMTPQHPPPTTASPCLQGGSGANGPSPLQAPSTHSHAYEPLLVGWIVGADDNDRDNSNRDKMTTMTWTTMTTGMVTMAVTMKLSLTSTMKQRG
jgi:hypothetical protein